jgi:hypothetical protein
MKQTTPHLNRLDMKTPGRRWHRLALLAALFAAGLSMASAQLTNNFTDGDGTDPTPLDQYPGAAGNGWAAGWVSQLGIAAGLVAGVSSASPLSAGGNYLNWQLGGGTAGSTIRRQFNPAAGAGTPVLDINRPYVIEFDYRTDVLITNGVGDFTCFNNSSDQITISQNGATGSDVVGRATFWVKAQGAANSSSPGLAPRRWSFFEGGLAGTTESRGLFINSTNVAFATNTVYHFRFDVDPVARDYEGTVSDGANTFNTKEATGRRLRWRNYAMASDANNLSNTTIMTFTARNNQALETNVQSLDSLVIYQLSTNLWPVVISQVSPLKAQTFFPASSNLVFTAQTFGTNSLPSNGAQLTLNGVNVSAGLTLDGDDTTNNRTITYTGALAENTVYEGRLTVADQAGRATTLPFFFDTFSTNGGVVIIETENFNFDPSLSYCSALQIDGTRPDRYIQNWLYGGASGLDPSGATNVVDSYFARNATSGIDFFQPSPVTGNLPNFRGCGTSPYPFGIRNSTSDEYERPWVEAMGINEYINDRMTNGTWFNYTHEWPTGQYLVYLRAGVNFTNATFELGKVVESGGSSYNNLTQTTNKLGTFIMTNAPARREIFKNYLPYNADGYNFFLSLSGKETLRLMVASGDTGDSTYLNRMVFVPAPSLVITNVSLSGSDLSFSINTVAGVRYSIQTNSIVDSGTWSTMTTVKGTGGQVVIHDTPVATTNLFYRAVSP